MLSRDTHWVDVGGRFIQLPTYIHVAGRGSDSVEMEFDKNRNP